VNRAESIKDREIVLNWRAAIGPLAALVLLGLGLWNLGAPAMWWDEGWTLSVARTWVERGHYGRLLDGQPAPPGLEASFTVTAPIALFFRLLGVGIWQGRLFGVLCTVAALVLVYRLALRLYDRRVAIGTLAVLLLMSMHPQLHPLIMGRQVLAEMPMLCYLLAGYICLPLAFRRPLLFLPPMVICWGLALITKAQVLPFWALSIAVPLLWSLLARRWKAAALLAGALLGSLGAMRALVWLWPLLLRGHTMPATLVSGLYEVLAVVPGAFNRLFALSNALMFGLPTLLGLCYAAWRVVKDRHNRAADAELELVRVALLVLAGSWFAWFVLLSVGVPRYLFPATFVGSIFVAALLSDLTNGYSLSSTLERSGALLRRAGFGRTNAAAALALVLIAMTLPITLQTLYRFYVVNADSSASETAVFLDTQTPAGALVETYESELHFLLNRRYHYPPDQLHVELNRRSLLGQEVAVDYDPLAANPDYLVVGTFSHGNQLYDPAISAGAFRLVRTYGGYAIYERVR
jgi:4-amino-4-deoxy-L-arabinose transferase-like glycosyltransferase